MTPLGKRRFAFFSMFVYNNTMKKRFIILIVILLTIPLLVSAAGDDVLESGSTGSDIYAIQRRLSDLGYFNYRPTGKFSGVTTAAVRAFQQANGLPDDGQIGDDTLYLLFSQDAVRNGSNPEFSSPIGRAFTGNYTQKGELSSWEYIDTQFLVDDVIKITDYNTGSSFEVKRVGGENSAHVVTQSADDFDTYTYIFGGDTWEHRPVIAEINGVQYAASLFGMPTRTQTYNTSGMNGYTVLYFNNSKTDVLGISDEEHLVSITSIAS